MPRHHISSAVGALAVVLSCPAAWAAGELFAHSDLALHRGPGQNFSVLTTVTQGTKFSVLWCNATADWCLVDDGLLQGWLPIDDIRSHNSASATVTAVDAGAAADAVARSAGGADGSTGSSGGEVVDPSGGALPAVAPAAATSVKLQ